jgi:hypothetical protein
MHRRARRSSDPETRFAAARSQYRRSAFAFCGFQALALELGEIIDE